MADHFSPKDFLVAPQLFGHPDAGWRPWDPAEAAQVARAWLQHRFVGRITVAIEEETEGIQDFSRRVGLAVRSVKDKLAGRQPIVVDDLINWPLVLGADKYPRIEQSSDFLPPSELVRSGYKAEVVPIARQKQGV
jgi:hypothetical protein